MEDKLKIGRDVYDFVWGILERKGAEVDSWINEFLKVDGFDYFYYKYAKKIGKKVSELGEKEKGLAVGYNSDRAIEINAEYKRIRDRIIKFKYEFFDGYVFTKKELPAVEEGQVGGPVFGLKKIKDNRSEDIRWSRSSNRWEIRNSDMQDISFAEFMQTGIRNGDKIVRYDYSSGRGPQEYTFATYTLGGLYDISGGLIKPTQSESAKVIFCKVLLILFDKYESGQLVGKSKYALRKMIRDAGLGQNKISAGLDGLSWEKLNEIIKIVLDIISLRGKVVKYKDLKFRGFIMVPNYVNKAKFKSVKSFSMRLYFAYRLHLMAGKKFVGNRWAPWEGYIASFNKKDEDDAISDSNIVLTEGTRSEIARKRYFYKALKDFMDNVESKVEYGEVSKKIEQVDDSVVEINREVIWSRGTFKKQMGRDMEDGVNAVKVKVKTIITIVERYTDKKPK